jgi:carotenoid cleavage dioxygenase-like enzyme
MVCSLRFGEDGLRFTNRFVQTRKLADEEAAGRFLYRGFGTSFPGDRLRRNIAIEPPVNVSVYPYAGSLVAFGEQTLPYQLDPVTLETRGEYDFHGALNEVSPFSAHPKCDRGLLNFGVVFAAKQPALNIFEFDTAGNLQRRRRYPLRHPYSIHDFGFTPNRAVFFLSPFLMKFERFWNDGASIMESLSWEPERGSRIFIAPRLGCDSEPFTVETGGGYCLHVINCYETGDRLIVDLLLLDAPVYSQYQPVPDLFATTPRCRPVRYSIDLETRGITEISALDYSLAQDFPAIDTARAGRSYSGFWVLGMSQRVNPGRKFFDQLAHGSWEYGVRDVYTAPRGEYLCAEPCFIANPTRPEEAVVICEMFRAPSKTMYLILFDAWNVHRGPVASIPLRRPVAPGYHTSFAPAE